jgi:formylglycine-generating enzyme required for sulfatase activity
MSFLHQQAFALDASAASFKNFLDNEPPSYKVIKNLNLLADRSTVLYYLGQALQLLRGGSWNNNPANCRSAYRNRNNPDNHNKNNYGFRVVFRSA